MARVVLEIPDVWVSEDAVLYCVAYPNGELLHRDWGEFIKKANAVLRDANYEDRLVLTPLDIPPIHNGWEKVWVSPAYIATENWPKTSVSRFRMDDWVMLWRIDLEQLGGDESSD